MPKKTKQEKIIAQYRKRLKLLEQLQGTNKKLEVRDKKPDDDIRSKKDKIPSPNSAIQLPTSNLTPPLREYFIHDLKKSLIFILAIIALEIAVYFGTISNYFKNLKLF